ncbi:f-box and wd domain containing protein [Grosmannia clavigera kw1407]|uniref:F-box and wd domain containing protein n=1 Tax=Grosmannia clavigera (strain kw1407 / UAMH 11150) TaxID=655863 RepID=F0XN64_GROCL|nr:f-box and wd domain containing protein [Grosmannia clavigera kw1407]EFX00835.1 f-box and wd domain containing protein [Grosmannia clavigera kw1407]
MPPSNDDPHDVFVTDEVVAPPTAVIADGTITSTTASLDAPIPFHPLGVRPLGNKYFASGPDAKAASGTFQALPDEMVMQVLEWLDASSLAALGYTCKFLYAFCDYDDLWKSLALGADGGQLQQWRGTWRESLMGNKAQAQSYRSDRVRIDCRDVFSDVLHRPFVCSYASPAQFACNIPKANQIRRFADLSYDEFADKWSDTPFVLTECVRSWRVFADWSLDKLRSAHGSTLFRAESVDWPYALYDQYISNTTDESPLYLFDRKFAEKMKLRVGQDSSSQDDEDVAYWKPDCFGPDLFEVLGSERPAHQWLIVGPAGSGSTFHKDPNGTSAWNAVVQGAKYWILFPPAVAVPGVFVSRDRSEVTSPLSIAEWLLAFHAEARCQAGCIEGVCRRGEILHVPSGWWHLVVNLEPGIALTQNFVSRTHLADVLLFLRDRPEQVTGFARGVVADPHGLFVERLRESAHADELRAAEAEIAWRDARRKRTWEALVGSDRTKIGADGGEEKRQCTEAASGFTFGFGGDDDDDLENETP